MSAVATEIPISQEAQNINGVQTITKTYKVEYEQTADDLAEASFEADGYRYTLFSFTKDEDIKRNEKEKTVTVEYKLKSKKASEALEESLDVVQPTVNYEDCAKNPGNFTGVLLIRLGTLSVSPVNEKTNHSSKSIVKKYTFTYK